MMLPAPDLPSEIGPESWFHKFIKVFTLIYIVYSLEVGFVLIMLPWKSIWESNLILHYIPQMEPVVASSFFKGAIVGLGIDNILIGIHEIIRLKSSSKK